MVLTAEGIHLEIRQILCFLIQPFYLFLQALVERIELMRFLDYAKRSELQNRLHSVLPFNYKFKLTSVFLAENN